MQLIDTDYRVLRELFGRPGGALPTGSLTVSVREIAQTTDLHRNTVRRRLDAMREGGVLEGFLFEPRPNWLGLVRAGHDLQGVVLPDAEELAERLTPFPFVSIAALHTESCFLHTWHEDEDTAEADVDQLAEALCADEVRTSYLSSRWPQHPADDLDITPLDRRLLLAMRRGFETTAAPLAEAVGITRRTASRRLRRLREAGAGSLIPMLKPGRIEGVVLVVYNTQVRTQEARASLAEAFPERLIGPTGTETNPMVLVPVATVDEAARRRAKARSHPGLEDLEMTLLREWLFPEASDVWLADRVQDAPPDEANP